MPIKEEHKILYPRIIVLLFLLLVVYWSAKILIPFVSAILSGLLIAYIFYPVHKWINARLHMPALSAAIVSFLIILAILTPLFFVGNALIGEAQNMYKFSLNMITSGSVTGHTCIEDSVKCSLVNEINGVLTSPQVRQSLQGFTSFILSYLVQRLTDAITSLPKLIIDVMIIFFITYYVLKDGNGFTQSLLHRIPVKQELSERLIASLHDVIHGVLFGSVLIALIEMIIAAIGFYLFGFSSPLFWAVIVGFLAFLPMVGGALVYWPAGIYMFTVALMNGDSTGVLRAIGLVIYGFIFISTGETILRPRLSAGKSGIHPVIILLGVLGGVTVFGSAGIIVGPVVLAILMTILHFYGDHKRATTNQ